MNEIEQLEKAISAAQEKLEKLKSDVSGWLFTPSPHQKYYYIAWNGVIECDSWDSMDVEEYGINFGNIWPTREAAEKHAKRLKLFNLLWQYSDEISCGEHYFVISHYDFEVYTYLHGNYPVLAKFKTKEKAEEVKKTLQPLFDEITGEDK
jgi:hypothetical protein